MYTVLATRRIARIDLETGEAEEICAGDMIATESTPVDGIMGRSAVLSSSKG